ncbi:VOC family protein [Marinobacter sp. CHS3-4]|uniref:VOC family protein n=1 Tax=Marinobacter sp. CHS3-4 TaxID=3045174 RepID=UPI0024B4C01C|nr:VOC family protein [Marinobacter sp. CHS3-4]MDI9244627.1 VOC family protein [Marinobacter sp. CHS3-4]
MSELLTNQPRRHPNPTVKAQKLAYLLFERPDLDRAERFLTDFGLRLIEREADALTFRAADTSPFCYRVERGDRERFLGFGLEVGSAEDLQKLSSLPGASAVEDAPYSGGGQRVKLKDPSGFLVEAIHGQALLEATPHRNPLSQNVGEQLARINDTQRLPMAPPQILKLGHVVLEVADFQDTCAWYTQHFGFIPSDVQVLPDGSPAVVFMRLDLGDTPADHHTLAMAQGFMPAYSHSAYEVVDADAVGMGQQLLRDHGWKHAWGIGRHLLGSQIFDYWEDAWGAKHEHYCDGDVFTAEEPMGVHPVSRGAMAQWGQAMPASFTRPKFSAKALAGLIRSLRGSPDVTVRKLRTLAKLFT